jgi:hypothetical protein
MGPIEAHMPLDVHSPRKCGAGSLSLPHSYIPLNMAYQSHSMPDAEDGGDMS